MNLGSLCTGYGGLDLAAEQVLGVQTVWVSDIDPGARLILAERFPNCPNLGDLTQVDWRDVEPVDVLTAGYPCQPFSHAGKRKGVDDERHIWPHIWTAVCALRPRLVLLENVAGHLSLGFGRVLADLAAAGYDTRWACLRAADVGAPHGRLRVFICATDANLEGLEGRVAQRQRAGQRAPRSGGVGVAPDTGSERHGRGEDAGAVGRMDRADAPGTRQRQRPRAVPVGGGEATPADAESIGWPRRDEPCADMVDDRPESSLTSEDGRTWGVYAPAIHRWENVLGRAAPAPTEPRRNGPRLAPRFVEWMMGLPTGWVTDIPGLSRNAQLKALGNGVVPQQAAAAIAHLISEGLEAA